MTESPGAREDQQSFPLLRVLFCKYTGFTAKVNFQGKLRPRLIKFISVGPSSGGKPDVDEGAAPLLEPRLNHRNAKQRLALPDLSKDQSQFIGVDGD